MEVSMGLKTECLVESLLKKQLNPRYLSSESRCVTSPPEPAEVCEFIPRRYQLESLWTGGHQRAMVSSWNRRIKWKFRVSHWKLRFPAFPPTSLTEPWQPDWNPPDKRLSGNMTRKKEKTWKYRWEFPSNSLAGSLQQTSLPLPYVLGSPTSVYSCWRPTASIWVWGLSPKPGKATPLRHKAGQEY